MYPRRTTAHAVSRPPRSAIGNILDLLLGQPKDRTLKRTGGTIAGVLMLVLVLIGIIRTMVEGGYYKNIPWKPYSAPDGSFTVKFPGDPKESVETRNINGDIWKVVSLQSKHRYHLYWVEYVDLHMVVTKANSRNIMERFIEDVISQSGGKYVSDEETSLSRNPALKFEAVIPAQSEGSDTLDMKATMRGVVALRGNRLYVVWTAAGVGNPHKEDLEEFMSSFQIPPPADTGFAF